MRVKVATLGTALLAVAACSYLLYQLHAERERLGAANDEIAALQALVGTLRGHLSPPAAAQRSEPTVTPKPKPSVDSGAKPQQQEFMQALGRQDAEADRKRDQFIADVQSTDPATHRKLLAEFVDSARSGNPGLAEALGLRPDEEHAMIELLAEGTLRTYRAALGRTDVTDAEQGALEYDAERKRQLAELLGAERLEQYEAYRATVPERRQIAELRSRLDGRSTLSNDQATHLIAAMHEERERYMAHSMEQPGAGYSSPDGPSYFYSSYEPGSPQDVEFLEGQLQRSREFVRRMHERAARILSAEQLRRFDDYQAERLAIERSNVERARGNQ